MKCKYGDLLCPCQDGDFCHYVNTKKTRAWPVAHEPNANCWCGPELDYVDPDTGAAVYVHKEAH